MFKSAIFRPKDVEGTVIGLEPKIFNTIVPNQVIAAGNGEKSSRKFQINELSAKTTGLDLLQQRNLENQIDAEVLKKLKTVEEKAYGEAYKLGQEDGKKKAFDDFSKLITDSLAHLKSVTEEISEFKAQMFVENEEHFIKLIHHLVECIVYKTIQEDPSVTLSVLRKALDDTHSDEEIVLKLNKEDMEYLDTVTDSSKKPWENAKKIKIEVQEGINRGGCIIETNHGVIDARIETRIQKAWKSLESRIPKTEHD